MVRYIIKRVFAMIISLWCIITITFVLMHSIPGGPFTREKPLPEAIIKVLNERYKLDDPLIQQYWDYLSNAVRGDFGPSFQHQDQMVADIIAKGLPYTMRLGGTVLIVVILLGVPLGIIAALRQNKSADYVVMLIATIGITIPGFVMAALLMYIFSMKLGWFPAISSKMETWKAMVLPVAALCGYPLSFITRLTKSSMLDVLQQDYIRTARAKGISETKVVLKHALKNGLIPVITYMAPLIAALLTGSFVVERTFTIPGIGRLYVESITGRDYTAIMGMTIFFAVILIVLTFVVDLLYGLIDPRIKLGVGKGGE